MDIPDFYKRRINFKSKGGDIKKPVPKTNATLIVTSARESLKQLQVPKPHFPPQRKLSHNSFDFFESNKCQLGLFRKHSF